MFALVAVAQDRPGLAPSRTLDPEAGLSVILLGTGIPLPNSERATACTAVIAGDRVFLVDTGRNCVVPITEAGLRDLEGIFYTHYHSDHFIGLGELLLNAAIAGADIPVSVHGPVGAKEVVDGLVATYRLDLKYRVDHHGDKFSGDATIPIVTEHEPGVVYDERGLRITMFTVVHPPIVPAVGYRFEYKGKTVVVSGDTIVCPELAAASRNADLLVSEALNAQLFQPVLAAARNSNPRWAKMIEEGIEYHANTLELAKMAQDVGVKKLAITHLMPSIPPTEAMESVFIRGMSDFYKGPIIVGRDGTEVTP